MSGMEMTMDAACPFLSVLAAGIANSTRLHEKLGGSEASWAVDRCLKRIERAVEASGGRIVQTGGDETLAAFDSADAVVNAAIEMQQRIAGLPPVSGVKMTIRVGISCGRASRPDQPDDGLVRETAHLMGIARSGQTLANGKILEALPETMRMLVTDTALTLPNESGGSESIVEIAPSETPAAGSAENGLPRESNAAGFTGAWLRLCYGQDTVVLDERSLVITMGRDGACDIVIRNPRASRRHATIKRCGNLVVLTDKSTNGTYVTIKGNSEQFVRHSECSLYRSGIITFASSSFAPDTDSIHFVCP